MNKRYIDFVPVDKKKVAKPKVAVPKSSAEAKKSTATARKSVSIARKPVSASRNPVSTPRKPVGAVKRPVDMVKKTVGPAGPRITKYLKNDKIEKRPLSTTYIKRTMPAPKVVVAEDEPSEIFEKKKTKNNSPERIIAKPDKDSKAGMIIAVILTIILGAAAGTVAFLILPK